MDTLDRDILFVGLTRPQMLFGVTYGFLVANAIVTTELFLLFKSPWILLVSLAVHAVGWIACFRDPRFFELWVVKIQRCPRVANRRIWHCNSYRP